ncbi:DNA helicase IV [Thermocatellispora tengchongensis]|uniref:DNA helicase IV n=1 Tax=Thermocatellispora tengchongensis TaxID=1073253 RepID=A0A840P8D9_9ACTN|nr:ATP-binding domain-containing protein [Thermocatellispora tengchongensis]MBB5135259.1 DNA helicase IV [Thermocatellispora tengchongensis]
MLYERLDDLREYVSGRLCAVLRENGGTAQSLVERETAAARYHERLAHLQAAENGLCFGRLDFRDGERRYIGRIGLLDDGDGDPLLLDWRAPAARAFYLATAASPDGVRRRRHIRIRHRDVTEINDEILDLEGARQEGGVTGEAALLAAVSATRTGRMGDIVETIQAEQDRIIRDEHRGVLVVQGGPGTGKTVVALHRAACLLYTHRETLARRGVLIVGPNTTFLRYIGQVLPSLGETGVLLATVGELYPGLVARRAEPAAAAEIKGRAAMAEVVAAAVRDRQWVPEDALDVVLDRETVPLTRADCERIRERARASLLPHNQARPIVFRGVVDALARTIADLYGEDVLGGENLFGEEDVEEIRAELRTDPGVREAVDRLWPALTPQDLLTGLYASAEWIAAAAPGLTEAERALLLREPGGGWTPADVPLLDEAAELLGEDTSAAEAEARRRHREQVAFAQEVLHIAEGSRSTDQEDDVEDVLSVTDLLDAEALAGRHEDADTRTAAERAAADRTWTFGHVIVDEAQELSPMAWRLLMRRCPTRWMTLVGDVAQTGDPAGASSWEEVLAPYAGDRWRLARLNVNYRMPAEIAEVAADVLAELDPGLESPRSVRATGVRPWRLRCEDLAAGLPELVRREAAAAGEGRVAVIVPAGRLAEAEPAVVAAAPGASVSGRDAEVDLERPVSLLTVRDAKGLEFDSVILVDPAGIVAESPRGLNDLYVALTRATQRLGVVHPGPVPAHLARLEETLAD